MSSKCIDVALSSLIHNGLFIEEILQQVIALSGNFQQLRNGEGFNVSFHQALVADYFFLHFSTSGWRTRLVKTCLITDDLGGR